MANWWPKTSIGRVVWATLIAIGLGAAVLLLFAAGQGKGIALTIASSLMTAGAAFAVGWIVGCLFGIPQSNSPTEAGNAAAAPAGLYKPSNQLQQVSDWLVKILLGASLTQLGNIAVVGRYFGGFVGSEPAAMTVLAYFFVVGILSGYFVMVVYLGGLIKEAGYDLISTLEKLGRTEIQRDQVEIEYALYQSLYESPAEQAAAVERAEAYLREHPEGSADIFGHLACAYGQLFQRKRAAGMAPDSEEAKQLRETAVNYGRQAVERDPEWAAILRNAYNAGEGVVDNDWAVFRPRDNDPDGVVKAFIDSLPAAPTG